MGALRDDDNGDNSGSAYVFKKSDIPSDPNWYKRCKLIASDGATDDEFGISISVSGGYAVVGAPYDDDNGNNSGSAYIYKISENPCDPNWYKQVKLTASDGDTNDLFGYSVSVSGDYAIVGALLDDDNGDNSGSAYVFKKSDVQGDPNWYEQCKLIASDGAIDDVFGVSVSVSGGYAIVGAFYDDDNGSYSGSAYIFERSEILGDPNWHQQCKLTASDAAQGDLFGFVSINGNYAIVGARGNDNKGIESGSAYIFKLTCPPADLDGDCYVDFKDLAVLSNHWLQGIGNQ